MKFHSSLALSVLTLVLGFSGGTAFAQTPPAANQATAAPSSGGDIMSSISKEDMAKLLKARQQALTDNPDLKTEQEALSKQREAIRNNPDATPADKMAFAQSMTDHQQKMRAAILKIDPTLAPALDKLDQQMKQKMLDRAAQGDGGN